MTKLALLNLSRSEEFKNLGARILVPVHDEILIEVPLENAERAGELLSSLMSAAGDFLPFTISCDVECSYRWYGLSHPCPYIKPESMENLSSDGIKWIQYHLVECEYELPLFPDENGDKPRGDAAHGVNGQDSPEFRSAILHYMNRYKLSNNTFIDHIEKKVVYGVV